MKFKLHGVNLADANSSKKEAKQQTTKSVEGLQKSMPRQPRTRGEKSDAGASEPAREQNPRAQRQETEGGEANPTASNPDPGSAAGKATAGKSHQTTPPPAQARVPPEQSTR